MKLKVYYLDSWDTEVATINVAGFVTSRTWYFDWGSNNICGAGYRDEIIWEILQGSHTADTISIAVTNGLDEDAWNGKFISNF